MPSFNPHSANTEYLEHLYEQYQKDPDSLDDEWVTFFKGFEFGYWKSDQESEGAEEPEVAATPRSPAAAEDSSGSERRGRERTDKGVHALVQAYRNEGHFIAQLDPLGHNQKSHPLLELSEFALSEDDLEKGVGFGGFHGKADGSLKDLLEKLHATYCRTLGVDFMAIFDKEQRTWLQKRIEPIYNRAEFTQEQSKRILWQLIETEEFEQFLHTRYIGQKRFSIEGGEALLPLLDTLVEVGGALGVDEMVIGMAHRGRLNVLAHLLHKPYELILGEFEGAVQSEGAEDEGDVKYHQGYSYDHITRSGGRKIHLSLSPNPSHLELVNPVIEGIVQAKQDYLHDAERGRVVPVQIHGEAAFTGQGIVAETLNLAQLEGYKNGGTVHIIINNQLGYTATPAETRFTTYPTDVARQIQAPVFHVNADDPEAVVHAARLAMEFRQEFKRDVLIDLWCYRRYGHNEADDPTVTQPLMYQEIAAHSTVGTLYTRELTGQGKVVQEEADEMHSEVRATLDRCQEKAHRLRAKPRTNTFGGVWQGLTLAGDDWDIETAVDLRTLEKIARKATEVPAGFSLHRTLQRIMKARVEMAEGKQPVDWGCGEMLAFGSLLLERIPVRLAGQDSQRGTFAHRHAVWHDGKNGETYTPLANLAAVQGKFEVFNTMLSELAVLGFEYGIASSDPRRLIMWEAQFGDFVNGAQLILDQYISSAEAKWHRMSGIVLLLPHGYEGMGPEHSSARLERFLQLCAKNNLQVCYPSTPAQIFHVLRRQMLRSFRKPLIVMTPKSLLRHKLCVSAIGDFTKGGFLNVIDDAACEDPEEVERVVLCTGKVYYELAVGREQLGLKEVALVRVEQLYPFPERELRAVLERYTRAVEVCWVQEESRNMGAWNFVQPLLDEVLREEVELAYIGRDEAASPAVGVRQTHQEEQQEIVDQAMNVPSKRLVLDIKQDHETQVSGEQQAGTGE
jgi:2-oxoglutarate dehydrogenase E1 component